MRIFDYDGPIAKVMINIINMLILNFCFLICCLPIFTIGASFCAISSVFLMDQDESGVFVRFCKAFRSNFKQATTAWLVFLVMAAILALDYYFLSGIEIPGESMVRIVLYVATFILLGAICFAFPLIVKFDNSLFHTLKNSFIFAITLAPLTVLMLLIAMLPLACWLFSFELFARILMLWMLVGFALSAQINCVLIKTIFSKLFPNDKKGKG